MKIRIRKLLIMLFACIDTGNYNKFIILKVESDTLLRKKLESNNIILSFKYTHTHTRTLVGQRPRVVMQTRNTRLYAGLQSSKPNIKSSERVCVYILFLDL